MRMNKLGDTDILVSQICLGTMTYGRQNSEKEGFSHLDLAFERGVNFFDTAEMYPFPSSPMTFGKTEKIIGNWIKSRQNREAIIIASKIVGPSSRFSHVRDGKIKFNKKHLTEAVDASLKRLQTDYIDLYQTHWPERPANYFGQLGYKHDDEAEWTPFSETLEVMKGIVLAGKVRAFGLSNETSWGLSEQLKISDKFDYPRPVSIQNPYNLLNRTFEIGLAEISIREQCGLLAYSPLGFGALTGKHLDGAPDPKSRHTLFPEFGRYFNQNADIATAQYVALAKKNGMTPTQMALAFVNTQNFLTSNIIGARTLKQLNENLATHEIKLSSDMISEIERIHLSNSNPSP